jgi:osmotically inducible protein OsmC
MSDITRKGLAQWNGGLKDGNGKISGGSGVLKDLVYSVPSRFESGNGTSPEELIAGAHAGCFSMMLAKLLSDQNKKPAQINTTVTLTMRVDASGPKISKAHLVTEASVPGLDDAAFQKVAAEAKDKCPVSVLLKPGLESLTFEAKLK